MSGLARQSAIRHGVEELAQLTASNVRSFAGQHGRERAPQPPFDLAGGAQSSGDAPPHVFIYQALDGVRLLVPVALRFLVGDQVDALARGRG